MTHHISINNKRLKFLESLKVEKNINRLSDKATIIVPGMRASRALEVEKDIKRGAPVEISCGYDGNNHLELSGFVASVATNNSLTIQVEDNMFTFRVPAKNKLYKNISAPDLIADVIKEAGLEFDVKAGDYTDEIVFSKFTVRDVSAHEALAKIKRQTGYNIYLRGKELHLQLRHFSDRLENKINYNYSVNIEKSNLKYYKEEERPVQVEVIGIDKENKSTPVLVGQPGGDKITVYRYNLPNQKALESYGLEILKKYSFTGYQGTLTGWLLPLITVGDTAQIINPEYPDRQGAYMVESMRLNYSKNTGGERRVGLGIRL